MWYEHGVGEENGRERGLRGVSSSLQTSCKLASRVGPKLVDFVAPVVALLCSRRLHDCRGRAGERIFEGYRLFEKAIVVIKPVGSLLSLVNALSHYFICRHSPEQGYRPIRPQSLR